jgi:hypothetical protein
MNYVFAQRFYRYYLHIRLIDAKNDRSAGVGDRTVNADRSGTLKLAPRRHARTGSNAPSAANAYSKTILPFTPGSVEGILKMPTSCVSACRPYRTARE